MSITKFEFTLENEIWNQNAYLLCTQISTKRANLEFYAAENKNSSPKYVFVCLRWCLSIHMWIRKINPIEINLILTEPFEMFRNVHSTAFECG